MSNKLKFKKFAEFMSKTFKHKSMIDLIAPALLNNKPFPTKTQFLSNNKARTIKMSRADLEAIYNSANYFYNRFRFMPLTTRFSSDFEEAKNWFYADFKKGWTTKIIEPNIDLLGEAFEQMSINREKEAAARIEVGRHSRNQLIWKKWDAEKKRSTLSKRYLSPARRNKLDPFRNIFCNGSELAPIVHFGDENNIRLNVIEGYEKRGHWGTTTHDIQTILTVHKPTFFKNIENLGENIGEGRFFPKALEMIITDTDFAIYKAVCVATHGKYGQKEVEKFIKVWHRPVVKDGTPDFIGGYCQFFDSFKKATKADLPRGRKEQLLIWHREANDILNPPDPVEVIEIDEETDDDLTFFNAA